jgi:hypothetical protein
MPLARFALLSLPLALPLGGCSDEPTGPTCPGISNPEVLELSELTPAIGASVPNDAIVHSFVVTGDIAFASIAFGFLEGHEAGKASPPLELSYAKDERGVVYTAEPTSFENAPSHVEIGVPVVYETPDGCAYRLPSPLFSYELTTP